MAYLAKTTSTYKGLPTAICSGCKCEVPTTLLSKSGTCQACSNYLTFCEKYRWFFIKRNPDIKYADVKGQIVYPPSCFTGQDWINCLEYWDHKCAVCGQSNGFWWGLSIDHWIPNSLETTPGHVPWNIVPLCIGMGSCNVSKKNLMPDEWLIKKYGIAFAAKKMDEIEHYFSLVQRSS